MSCTVYCPKCGETIPVQVVVDEDFVPSNPSLGRTGSSRDYDNFSNLAYLFPFHTQSPQKKLCFLL